MVTDNTWSVNTDGAIRYANEYDGEMMDASRSFVNGDMDGWTRIQYDDSRWAKASVVKSPDGVLTGGLSPNMSVYAKEKPLSVNRYGNRFIVDFGTNNAGRIRMRYNVAKGDTVRIRHAELLGKDGKSLYLKNLRGAETTSYYVSDGVSRSWAPDFTYYGFRYVEVTGVESLDGDDIVRELIADRMDDTATDISVIAADGNNILNDIIANARRGIRSNYKGIPVDCPQRDERMPWLGDRTTGCLGESYMMDNHSLYAKWVRDICDSQKKDGSISDVSPAYWRLYNNNITWPAALPFACDMLYRQYGDLRPMTDCYPSIKRFLTLVHRTKYADGLITYDRYGDWCVPPESKELVHSKDPERKTDGILIASTYYYYLCKMMQGYAAMLGHDDDAKYFASECLTTQKAVNDTFLVDGNYSNATVTANLLPLAMDMVPAECRDSVYANMMRTIVDKNGGNISAGVIGIQWLMRYLSLTGRGDVAYKMATSETYPGWGYMVKNGATTIWELWNGNTADPSMNSGNHVMLLGDLLPWCYENLGGISAAYDEPGFRKVVMRPDFSVMALNGVTASHPSPYGMIKSSWKRDGNSIVWNVDIPANTSADVYLPNGKLKHIGSGDYVFKVKSKR